jgi:transmembrane sensor
MTVERRDPAATAAAGWYARLRADDAGTGPDGVDRAAFRDWHDGDPAHARSWAAIARAERGLDALRGDGRGAGDARLAAMIAAAKADAAPARRWRATAPGWAMAAALLLTLGVTGGLLAGRAMPPARQAVAATAIGQVRQLRLPDGSAMTLDAQSVAVIDEPGAERRVRIDRGRAMFAVTKDKAHPFVVAAGDASVTALGTQFSVELEPGRLTVALVEGSVRVDLPGRSRQLAPGDVLTLADGAITVQAGAAAIGTEWRTGTLTFDSLPLAEVVARLNHYSPQRIVIADPALARRPFSGVLDTRGGNDALVTALAAYRTARVTERTRDHITLAPF